MDAYVVGGVFGQLGEGVGSGVGGGPFWFVLVSVEGDAVVVRSVGGPADGSLGVGGLRALVDHQVAGGCVAVGGGLYGLPALLAVCSFPHGDPVIRVRCQACELGFCGSFGERLGVQVLDVALLVDDGSGHPPLVFPVGVFPFDVYGCGGVGLALDGGRGRSGGGSPALGLIGDAVDRCLAHLGICSRSELHGVLGTGFQAGEGVRRAGVQHCLPPAAGGPGHSRGASGADPGLVELGAPDGVPLDGQRVAAGGVAGDLGRVEGFGPALGRRRDGVPAVAIVPPQQDDVTGGFVQAGELSRVALGYGPALDAPSGVAAAGGNGRVPIVGSVVGVPFDHDAVGGGVVAVHACCRGDAADNSGVAPFRGVA